MLADDILYWLTLLPYVKYKKSFFTFIPLIKAPTLYSITFSISLSAAVEVKSILWIYALAPSSAAKYKSLPFMKKVVNFVKLVFE